MTDKINGLLDKWVLSVIVMAALGLGWCYVVFKYTTVGTTIVTVSVIPAEIFFGMGVLLAYLRQKNNGGEWGHSAGTIVPFGVASIFFLMAVYWAILGAKWGLHDLEAWDKETRYGLSMDFLSDTPSAEEMKLKYLADDLYITGYESLVMNYHLVKRQLDDESFRKAREEFEKKWAEEKAAKEAEEKRLLANEYRKKAAEQARIEYEAKVKESLKGTKYEMVN